MGWFELDLGTQPARKPSRYYLAYGSNLSVERMKARCPNAVVFGLALIPGYRLLFKKSKTGSYATIEQDANCCVPALVYKISEYDETLLNRYEGYPEPYEEYFRKGYRDSGYSGTGCSSSFYCSEGVDVLVYQKCCEENKLWRTDGRCMASSLRCNVLCWCIYRYPWCKTWIPDS